MRTILTCLATTLALATATAQDTTDPRLRAAEVAEKSENDLPRAITILGEVFADATLPANTRYLAGRRLLDLLKRAGRDADAKSHTTRLVGFAGEHGIAIESGSRRHDPALERQIEDLIEKVSHSGLGDAARLAWIGERALGQIEKACRKENRVSPLANLLAVVIAIGGEKAEAILTRTCVDEDALRRRAVAMAFQTARNETGLGVRIRPSVIAPLASDREPEVRADALRRRIFGTFDSYLANLRDADRRVREAVLEVGLPDTEDLIENLDHQSGRVLTLATVLAGDGELHGLAESLIGKEWMHRMPPQTRAHCWLVLPRSVQDKVESHYEGMPPDVLQEELCAAVERAAASGSPPAGNGKLRRIAESITTGWTGKSFAHWMRLAKAGILGNPEVFERHAKPADRHRLLVEVDVFGMVSTEASNSANRVARAALGELPEAGFETLRSILERITRAPRDSQLATAASSWSYGILRRMATFEHPAAIEWAERALVDPTAAGLTEGSYQPLMGTNAPQGVWDAVETSVSDTHRRLRNRILVVDDGSRAALRNFAFDAALRARDVEAIPLFPRAYELGLVSAGNMRGLAGFGRMQPIDADFIMAALDACLATGNETAWSDAKSVFHWIQNNVRGRSTQPVFLRHIARLQPAKEREDWFSQLTYFPRANRQAVDAERLGEVLSAWLRDPSPAVVQKGLNELSRVPTPWPTAVLEIVEELQNSKVSELRERAIRWLCRVPPAITTDRLHAWLRDPDRAVANTAARELLERDPIAAVDSLVPLLEKGQLAVSLGHDLAMRTMDLRLVPILLRDLRNDNPELRTSARAALDAIEYYTQQEQRWRKLVAAGGVEAKDPAEALLRQAREATDELQLLAIDSLGTLGKPEVLPFLIDMLGSATDDTVKSRLRAAIARINALR